MYRCKYYFHKYVYIKYKEYIYNRLYKYILEIFIYFEFCANIYKYFTDFCINNYRYS